MKQEERPPAARARDAERLCRGAVEVWSRTRPGSAHLTDAKGYLGSALVTVAATDRDLTSEACRARLAEAEPLLLQRARYHAERAGSNASYRRETARHLVRLYETWDAQAPNTGKAEQMAQWKRALADLERPAEDSSDTATNRSAKPAK